MQLNYSPSLTHVKRYPKSSPHLCSAPGQKYQSTVGSGNPATKHCSMPLTRLSWVRISGFAAGKERRSHVRLLENLTKTSSLPCFQVLRTFLRFEEDPEGTHSKGRIWSREGGRSEDQTGRGLQRAAQPQRGLSTLRTWGSPRAPRSGMTEVGFAGPPGRVSVSCEGQSERRLLIRTLGCQTVGKVEIAFKIPATRISHHWTCHRNFQLWHGLEWMKLRGVPSAHLRKVLFWGWGGGVGTEGNGCEWKNGIILFTEKPKQESRIQYGLWTPKFYSKCKIWAENCNRKPAREFYSYIHLNLCTITEKVNCISRHALIWHFWVTTIINWYSIKSALKHCKFLRLFLKWKENELITFSCSPGDTLEDC